MLQLGWEKGRVQKKNWAQSSARTTEIRAQFRAQTNRSLLRVNDQNSGTIQHVNETRSGPTILWAIDENMSTNLQAVYSSSAV